jgi:peptide deformylase
MAIRKVVTEGDDILRKHCREISDVNEHIRMTMEDMLETMRAEYGVGIAGPQVGVMRRMFVAEPEPGRVYYMINPEIVTQEGSQIGDEGCLSVPGLIGTVERPMKITIKALDLNGEEQVYDFEGFDARVMCHENDHLDGVLYTDKAQNIREPGTDEEEDEDIIE